MFLSLVVETSSIKSYGTKRAKSQWRPSWRLFKRHWDVQGINVKLRGRDQDLSQEPDNREMRHFATFTTQMSPFDQLFVTLGFFVIW